MRTVESNENKHSLLEFFEPGFVPLVGVGDKPKAPTIKWQNPESRLSWDKVRNAAGVAGILKEGFYIVDLDNEHADRIIDIIKSEGVKCRIHTTTKGYHVIFRKGSPYDIKPHTSSGRVTGLIPLCGLGYEGSGEHVVGKVDYLAQNLIILKLQGEFRNVVYETDEIEVCPAWLQPLAVAKKNNTDFFIRFDGLGEGDGRNEALFSFIGKAKTRGLSYADFVDCCRIINTYVFAVPFDAAEFEAVTRREAWENFKVRKGAGRPKGSRNKDKAANYVPTADGKVPFPKDEETEKPAYDVVAAELIDKFNIKRIDSKLHVYRNGVYRLPALERGGNILEHELEKSYVGMNNKTVNEVIGSIERQCLGSSYQADAKYINFRNGILNLETGELQEHAPDIVTINQVPHNLNPAAKSDLLEGFLTDIAAGDNEVKALLEEIAGASLYRGTLFDTMPILTGSGCNGKSTFISMLQNVVGVGNWSAVDIRYFDTDVNKFRVKELQGVTVNFSDDSSDLYIKDSSNLKKIISGNTISAEGKGKDAFNFNPYATVVISVNEMPRIKDAAGATTRRFLMVPFEAKFENPDYEMGKKLAAEEVAEALIVLGVNALQRVLKANSYTIPEKSRAALEEYKQENDSVKYFLDANTGEDGDCYIWGMSTEGVYRAYQSFCYDNGIEPMKQQTMSRRIIEYTKGSLKQQRNPNTQRRERVFVRR